MIQLFYTFPAIKGVQAKCEYYTCMIPLGLLNKLLPNTEDDVLPEYRAQRRVNESRIPVIKKYILENRDSYVFSSLTVSIDGEFEFEPSHANKDVGILKVSLDSKMLLNDGQHRKAAISAALEEDESLNEETISVVLFKDKGLTKSQQMFTDLNQHAVTTSKSLNALYDSKDIPSLLGKMIVDSVPFLKKYTDKERDNLGKYSHMLFTLNNFVNASKKIGSRVSQNNTYESIEQYAVEFWNKVVSSVSEWDLLEKRQLSKKDMRESYIVTQGVVILAIGYLCDYFYATKMDYVPFLEKFSDIDWLRSNESVWMGLALKPNGRINRTSKGIFLTYLGIKELIGVSLSESETKELREARSLWLR